jgi:hypothetical protein
MTKDLPPVPPAAQSNKGPPRSPSVRDAASPRSKEENDKNLTQQDRQGNVKQNTTNQGYQQDR